MEKCFKTAVHNTHTHTVYPPVNNGNINKTEQNANFLLKRVQIVFHFTPKERNNLMGWSERERVSEKLYLFSANGAWANNIGTFLWR